MTRAEFIRQCMIHSANYFKEGYYKTETWREGNKLWNSKEHLFCCPECGKKVVFSELEFWDNSDTFEEVMNNEVICSYCYEEGMGEDL